MQLERFRRALRNANYKEARAKTVDKIVDTLCFATAFGISAKITGLWGPLVSFLERFLEQYSTKLNWTFLLCLLFYPLLSAFAEIYVNAFRETFRRRAQKTETQ